MKFYRVKCITLSQGHDLKSISHLGGTNSKDELWYEAIAVVIQSINNGNVFYIIEDGRKKILKVMHDADGHPYLMVYADGQLTDSLLTLRECDLNEGLSR